MAASWRISIFPFCSLPTAECCGAGRQPETGESWAPLNPGDLSWSSGCRFLRPALSMHGSMGALQHVCTVPCPYTQEVYTQEACIWVIRGVPVNCNRVCVLRKLWCSRQPSMFLETLMVHCSCVPRAWGLSGVSAHLSLRQDVCTGNRHLFYDPGPPWMRKEHLLQTLCCTRLKQLAKSSGCCIPLLLPRPWVPRKASWDLPTILRYSSAVPRHPLPHLIRLHFNCGQYWEQKGWQRGRDWYLSLVFVPRSQRKEPLNLQHKRTSSFLSPSYGKNKNKNKKQALTGIAQTLSQGKVNRTGISCTDSLHRSIPPIHWARRPCWAQPQPPATGRNISGQRHAPNSSDAFPVQLVDKFTSFSFSQWK